MSLNAREVASRVVIRVEIVHEGSDEIYIKVPTLRVHPVVIGEYDI